MRSQNGGAPLTGEPLRRLLDDCSTLPRGCSRRLERRSDAQRDRRRSCAPPISARRAAGRGARSSARVAGSCARRCSAAHPDLVPLGAQLERDAEHGALQARMRAPRVGRREPRTHRDRLRAPGRAATPRSCATIEDDVRATLGAAAVLALELDKNGRSRRARRDRRHRRALALRRRARRARASTSSATRASAR